MLIGLIVLVLGIFLLFGCIGFSNRMARENFSFLAAVALLLGCFAGLILVAFGGIILVVD